MTPSSVAVNPPRPLWLADLQAVASTERSWLWQGYLVGGGVTLLTSQWKAGKTTLLSILLARLKAGGSLGGLSVRAGKALVLSEEDAGLWCERGRTLDLGGQVCWLCRPFLGKPTLQQWLRLLDDVLALRRDLGLDLFVVDTLAAFLPGDENNAGAVLAALTPLRRLTDAGMCVALLHHPRREGGGDGRWSRGSGALLAFVDVLIEMTAVRGAAESRARRLKAWSRYRGTPAELLLELSPDGTDYLRVPELAAVTAEPAAAAVPEALRLVLEEARYKLTRAQILSGWLPDFRPAPDEGTLCRWLSRAVEGGQVRRDGSGRRNDPFRYWLAQKEEAWKQDEWHQILEQLEVKARQFREAHPELVEQEELGGADRCGERQPD
jgi:hypothetical protein